MDERKDERKDLKRLLKAAEEKVRAERGKGDRTDWEGNHPEDRS